MKSIIFTLALLTACTGTAQKPEKKYKQQSWHNSTIVFYNVENLFDTIDDPGVIDEEFTPAGKNKWTSDRYATKLHHLAEAINLASPDKNPMLIGVVEIENERVLNDLVKTDQLAKTNYLTAHKDSPDARGIDCALLYDANRFTPLQVVPLAVTLSDEPDFKTRDVLYVRGQLKGGTIIHVFVNHWPSRRGGESANSEYKRIRAAEVARTKVNEILEADPNANIILMGDFNDHPTDKSVSESLGARPVTETGAQLYNLLYDDHAAGKGTHNYKNEWGVLDQFIVSAGLFNAKEKVAIKGNDAKIVYEEKLLFTQKDGTKKPSTTYGGPNYYGGYSDHLPISLQLK